MKKYLWVVLMAFFVTACDPNVRPDDSLSGDESDSGSGAEAGLIDGGDDSSGRALSVSYDKSEINNSNSVLAGRVIYFDYDSSSVSDDNVELAKHHGKYLAVNSDASIRLEGHTDERGTREYNIALADRRAQAVKKILIFQGASSGQVTIISYGEEKPAELGHDDSAWRLNRRAELVYQ